MKELYADSIELQGDQRSPEKGAAQNLLSPVRGKKRRVEGLADDVTRQLMVKQREMMANEFEQYYINKSLPIEVELSGPDKKYISLLSVLFCSDTVSRIAEKTNLFYCLREAGFEKVALGNSDEKSWVYDLKNT
ncbi:MAG TPA: hypothetical protein PLR60_05260 [Syntrophorhabdaceae bacterium]|nr:hypothetical protein [Syntrophorhabdaceae bacterium]